MNHHKFHIHVLLIEDNLMARVIAQSLLRDCGCTVDVASTGIEAIEKFNNHYDLLMLDLGLPDYEGTDLACMIRSFPGPISSVPIVALTAHANDKEHIALAKKAGFNGFFSKPLTRALCQALISELSSAKPGEANFWHIRTSKNIRS